MRQRLRGREGETATQTERKTDRQTGGKGEPERTEGEEGGREREAATQTERKTDRPREQQRTDGRADAKRKANQDNTEKE